MSVIEKLVPSIWTPSALRAQSIRRIDHGAYKEEVGILNERGGEQEPRLLTARKAFDDALVHFVVTFEIDYFQYLVDPWIEAVLSVERSDEVKPCHSCLALFVQREQFLRRDARLLHEV